MEIGERFKNILAYILITGGLIFGFYYLENNWLEDNK